MISTSSGDNLGDWSETGLYHYRARYYDPGTGRFINEDPIGLDGGLNLFRYNGNDPISYIDPLGFQRVKPCDEACEKASHSRLRLKLRTIVGNPRDATVIYDLSGMENQDYLIFQAESNPGRAVETEYGPGSTDFPSDVNGFIDHIRPGIGEGASDSEQTFWAIPIRKRPNGNGFWKLGPPEPLLVRDGSNKDFCKLKVFFDPKNLASINGNPITEHLVSFAPPKK